VDSWPAADSSTWASWDTNGSSALTETCDALDTLESIDTAMVSSDAALELRIEASWNSVVGYLIPATLSSTSVAKFCACVTWFAADLWIEASWHWQWSSVVAFLAIRFVYTLVLELLADAVWFTADCSWSASG